MTDNNFDEDLSKLSRREIRLLMEKRAQEQREREEREAAEQRARQESEQLAEQTTLASTEQHSAEISSEADELWQAYQADFAESQQKKEPAPEASRPAEPAQEPARESVPFSEIEMPADGGNSRTIFDLTGEIPESSREAEPVISQDTFVNSEITSVPEPVVEFAPE
ncbi:MAG: hypothetical protein Q4C71_01870, partial [Microbacteriaceae bacterium]|nr:hypothetical protein [Microbacteriaceae bacterium]